MELGYARVSTTHQDLERQLHALAKAGIPAERIYTDKQTGPHMNRPGWQAAINYARRRRRASHLHARPHRSLSPRCAHHGAAIPLLVGQLSARQSEREKLVTALKAERNPEELSASDIESIIAALGGLKGVLREATATEKASVYEALGVKLEFDPTSKRVRATAEPTLLLPEHDTRVLGRVRRGT